MDETQTYIKQCDCPEIQGQRSKEGIEIAYWVTRHLYISKSFNYWSMVKAPHVWLPRQDQIQEMINYCSTNFICGLYDWFTEPGGREDEFDSYEKLWLAYYMWEYHKKIWNGKKWVAEEIMTTNRR